MSGWDYRFSVIDENNISVPFSVEWAAQSFISEYKFKYPEMFFSYSPDDK